VTNTKKGIHVKKFKLFNNLRNNFITMSCLSQRNKYTTYTYIYVHDEYDYSAKSFNVYISRLHYIIKFQ